MNFLKKSSVILLLGVVVGMLHGCSTQTNQYAPDQVIHNALEESTPAYYGEVEITVLDKGEKTGETIREWRSDTGETRIESQDMDGNNKVISVNDGSVLTLYEIDRNEAFIVDDVETLMFNQPSPKEQANKLLETIRDTHEVSTKDGEEIAGRNTYHLIAEVKKKSTLLGDLELWIDKENWFVLKMISHIGDAVSEMTYTKIDFDAHISPDLFKIDLPADVMMKNLAEISNTEEIPLEEVPVKIGDLVKYFPETDELKISLIEIYGEQEVSIDYMKNDLPIFILSVFQSTEEEWDETLGESVEIRDQKGLFTEMGEFRSVLWQEEGITYSVLLIDPNLSLEAFIHMTEEMEVIKE